LLVLVSCIHSANHNEHETSSTNQHEEESEHEYENEHETEDDHSIYDMLDLPNNEVDDGKESEAPGYENENESEYEEEEYEILGFEEEEEYYPRIRMEEIQRISEIVATKITHVKRNKIIKLIQEKSKHYMYQNCDAFIFYHPNAVDTACLEKDGMGWCDWDTHFAQGCFANPRTVCRGTGYCMRYDENEIWGDEHLHESSDHIRYDDFDEEKVDHEKHEPLDEALSLVEESLPYTTDIMHNAFSLEKYMNEHKLTNHYHEYSHMMNELSIEMIYLTQEMITKNHNNASSHMKHVQMMFDLAKHTQNMASAMSKVVENMNSDIEYTRDEHLKKWREEHYVEALEMADKLWEMSEVAYEQSESAIDDMCRSIDCDHSHGDEIELEEGEMEHMDVGPHRRNRRRLNALAKKVDRIKMVTFRRRRLQQPCVENDAVFRQLYHAKMNIYTSCKAAVEKHGCDASYFAEGDKEISQMLDDYCQESCGICSHGVEITSDMWRRHMMWLVPLIVILFVITVIVCAGYCDTWNERFGWKEDHLDLEEPENLAVMMSPKDMEYFDEMNADFEKHADIIEEMTDHVSQLLAEEMN